MSSLGLLSVCRRAFLPVQSMCHPARALRTSFRSFSNTPQFLRPLPSASQLPKVANSAEAGSPRGSTWSQSSNAATSDIASQPMLNPYSGRTVTVTKNLGDSLKVLDGILARNKVRSQRRSTERHEKKGYKRRRLASERWRNQFANEVRKKVQLVMKMRDRGA